MLPQAEELAEVLDLVLVVAVGEADVFEAARGEARADRRPVPEIAGMVDDADISRSEHGSVVRRQAPTP